jgi:acetylglutamate kinase
MNTREVVVELLSQLGSSREAREYLRKYSDNSGQFAVIKVGGEVIENDLPRLSSAIGFLHHVGLFPIIIHGAGVQLNQALSEAGVASIKIDGVRVTTPEVMSVIRPVMYRLNRSLISALENLGIRTRSIQHGVFECEYENEAQLGLVGKIRKVHHESILSSIAEGALPIVTCLGETRGGQVMNINADVAAAHLVLEIQPQKIIFISPTGGLLDDKEQIISAINLETDYERLIGSDWVHSGMRLKLQQIAELLEQLPNSSSVSITSASNLTRELFTHRGAGTLIRRGEGFLIESGLTGLRQSELKSLIESCFGRTLTDAFFENLQLESLIWAGSGRAAGVMDRGYRDIAYMDKFAVTPTAQGEGVGAALWQQIQSRYPRLYWRSRAENPVNSWYNRQADFCIRRGKWQVFGYGIDDMDLIRELVDDAARRGEYWTDSHRSSAPEPSPVEGEVT